jgi:hypothetical protein
MIPCSEKINSMPEFSSGNVEHEYGEDEIVGQLNGWTVGQLDNWKDQYGYGK